jgi:hypothetical protein
MILKFPDLDALRLALTTGAVPVDISRESATAGFDEEEQVWIETSGSLSRSAQRELRSQGVSIQTTRRGIPTLSMDVSTWLELLPIQPQPNPPERSEQLPVLFEVASGKQLTHLATEILRLGNDRQGYRWLEEPARKNDDGDTRALLRVVGPPYYSLLRALDHRGQSTAPVAYIERAPSSGVWIEFGYTHPLLSAITAPPGQILLLRPPRRWTYLPDAPFRDIYEISEFPLPGKPLRYKEGDLDDRLKVTPILKPGGPADTEELWVLRDDPVAELNRFVQNADDQLLHRLAFAVGTARGGNTIIVVRVRQSKQAPPVLVLNAQAYQTYLRLPNLFLPVGTRLHPPLRRDEVRKLLAADSNQLTWLNPQENGSFVPESLPENAFRPLWDWVDYVLDHEHQALEEWVQASEFDFEPFICSEDDPPRERKKPPPTDPARTSRGKGGRADVATADVVGFTPSDLPDESEEKEFTGSEEDFKVGPTVEPSEVQKQLRALEEQFLAFEGGLDLPERKQLWAELAHLSGQLDNGAEEAGICWANAMWERVPPANWAAAWFYAEARAVPARLERGVNRSWVAGAMQRQDGNLAVSREDLGRLLSMEEPLVADLRTLAAYLVWAGRQNPAPRPLIARLNEVQQFLERFERLLPVRAFWLAWYHLVQLTQGDVLALARARDRVLERLYTNGLRPETDLPSFLRFAGQPTSQRFRAMREWMNQTCESAVKWLDHEAHASHHASAQTASYVDLIFSFGLARVGEPDASKELLTRAEEKLSRLDDAHQFLLGAYRYRIHQARDGKPHTGPLPNNQLEELELMERLQRYVVDRLRKHSRILEPDQKIDPYRHWGAKISDLEKALAELTDLTDRHQIINRVEKLLSEVPRGNKRHEQRARVIRAGLECAPRVNEEFARRMLEQVVSAYDSLPPASDLAAIQDRALFLEKSLFVAAHFDRLEHIHPLVNRFQQMLETQKGPQSIQHMNTLAGQCFRSLRKLGMRDEIDRLLRLMAEVILGGKDLAGVDFKKMEHGIDALQALLHVAAGWYYFGRDTQAEPVLQKTRDLLFRGDLQARDQTKLACSYAETVGQAPPEVAQKLLSEVFEKLRGVKDTYTTSSHFSVSQLDVVEAVVMAVVSDDFTLGTQARRWLDEDEFLIRRRIHSDVRKMM